MKIKQVFQNSDKEDSIKVIIMRFSVGVFEQTKVHETPKSKLPLIKQFLKANQNLNKVDMVIWFCLAFPLMKFAFYL